jgi:hypothetical protein
MLVFGLSFVTLLIIALALQLAGGMPWLGFVHTVFAVAALPLMLAAIQHFVPVLTRSRGAPPAIRALPGVAGLGGVLALATFVLEWPRWFLLLPALLVATAAAVSIAWILARMRAALGPSHPGVRWYVASLSFLLLGMLAVLALWFDPQRYAVWRQLHLHANLIGWVGLTALGTLPVLLPTVLREMQPAAAARLKRGLPLAAIGALGITSGAAAGWAGLAAAGALLLGSVVFANLRAWWLSYGDRLEQGAGASLALATGFLFLLLALGAVHGFGGLPGASLLPAYVFGFLLPLVLGALAQLLPVWRFPGPESPSRVAFAERLARHAHWRAILCLAAAALQLFDQAPAPLLAIGAVLHFAATLAVAWRARPDARL